MPVSGFKTLIASVLLLPATLLLGQTTNPSVPPPFIKMTKMEVKLGKLFRASQA
jgi:hypothetical protein